MSSVLLANGTVLAVIIGRLLIGYAVGTITGVAPVYGAEIAKVNSNQYSFSALFTPFHAD